MGYLKDYINKTLDGFISKLRRRNRRMVPDIGAWFNGLKNEAGRFINFTKGAASKAAATAVTVAKKINKLTKGKLAAGIGKFACPAIAKLVKYGAGLALAAVGWEFGVPECVIEAVEDVCQGAVNAAFKKRQRRM